MRCSGLVAWGWLVLGAVALAGEPESSQVDPYVGVFGSPGVRLEAACRKDPYYIGAIRMGGWEHPFTGSRMYGDLTGSFEGEGKRTTFVAKVEGDTMSLKVGSTTYTLKRVPPKSQAAGPYKVYKDWPFDEAEAKRRQEETAKALCVPMEQDIDLGKGVKARMVLIPAGECALGSPEGEAGRRAHDMFDERQKRVTIGKPFWLGKYEVTQEQWEAVIGSHESAFKGSKNPVESIPVNEVQQFLAKINASVGGAELNLPTDVQWEYACRAGTATPFHFGDTISTDQANYAGDLPYGKGPKGVIRKTTMPVGGFPANAWGLHDMHGNVSEYCFPRLKGVPEGNEPKAYWMLLPALSARGGCWGMRAAWCRSAAGISVDGADGRSSGKGRGSLMEGFRLARALEAPASDDPKVAGNDTPTPNPESNPGQKNGQAARAAYLEVFQAFRSNNIDGAIRLADQGLKSYGDTGIVAQDILTVKASCLQRKGDMAGAKTAFEAALKAAPESPRAEFLKKVLAGLEGKK